MTEKEEDEKESPFGKAVDLMESEYLVEEDSDMIEFHTDGSPIGEALFKIMMIESIDSDEISDTIDQERSIEKFTLMRLVSNITDTIEVYEGEDRAEEKIALKASDDVLLFLLLQVR